MVQTDSLRVLQILPSIALSAGGVTSAVVGLGHALQSLGAGVTVYTTNAATPANARQLRWGLQPTDLPARVDELEVQLFEVRRPQRWFYAPDLRRQMRNALGDYDVVHIHGLFLYPQFAAWREARRAGMPYVVSTHGMLDPYLRKRGRIQRRIATATWVRQMLNEASAIHCLTENERDRIADLSLRSDQVIIPNAMHLEDFSDLPEPVEFRQRFLAGSNAPLILNHGRLAPKKGLDILIDAMTLVRQRHPDALLALVGPDNEHLRAQLHAQAIERNFGDAVVFTGELTGRDLLGALAAADVWALPSRAEGLPYAVAEAMAAGRPVVASHAVSSAPDAHAEQALVMVDVDARSTATAIIELLNDPAERRALGDRGRQFVARYAWRSVGGQFLDLYGGIISDSRPRPATIRGEG